MANFKDDEDLAQLLATNPGHPKAQKYLQEVRMGNQEDLFERIHFERVLERMLSEKLREEEKIAQMERERGANVVIQNQALLVMNDKLKEQQPPDELDNMKKSLNERLQEITSRIGVLNKEIEAEKENIKTANTVLAAAQVEMLNDMRESGYTEKQVQGISQALNKQSSVEVLITVNPSLQHQDSMTIVDTKLTTAEFIATVAAAQEKTGKEPSSSDILAEMRRQREERAQNRTRQKYDNVMNEFDNIRTKAQEKTGNEPSSSDILAEIRRQKEERAQNKVHTNYKNVMDELNTIVGKAQEKAGKEVSPKDILAAIKSEKEAAQNRPRPPSPAPNANRQKQAEQVSKIQKSVGEVSDKMEEKTSLSAEMNQTKATLQTVEEQQRAQKSTMNLSPDKKKT